MVEVKIVESSDEIVRRIMRATASNIESALKKCQTKITVFTRLALFDAIKTQPEYNNIINGDLRYELGLLNAFARMQAIIDVFVGSVQVTIPNISFQGTNFRGKLLIEAVRADYSDVLGLPESSFLTEKGVQLNWLEWLLIEGENPVIADYHFQRLEGKGRTGGGLMLTGGNWGVPSQFAGTPNDNFITRAVEQIQEPMRKIIKQALNSI